jgi:hypothetical protein
LLDSKIISNCQIGSCEQGSDSRVINYPTQPRLNKRPPQVVAQLAL